ncbi:IMV protein [Sea otter poxvirus]|uniref:IMV protein n=1 Tax=Sea otter poxvirus TaxID=1416741 RepID=A0A2U9QHT9_9POXV|nr:IMV protein [Sea otter poxvirus]AWU47165.1 IMV protein [Sea otter poxvirus]
MEDDINEAALNHLLKRIAQCNDNELGLTASMIHDLLNHINVKLFELNKKAKKTKVNKSNVSERNIIDG